MFNTFEKESQIQAVGYVPSLVSESFVKMLVDATISYLNYAKDLEFAIASVSHTTLNFGKLLPQNGSIMSYDFYNATVDDTDWLIAIPRAIDIGSYQYVCAIVSENGNCYELNMSVIVA